MSTDYKIASSKGFEVYSPDYLDLADPDDRVKRLLGIWAGSQEMTVLVGSSMVGMFQLSHLQSSDPAGLFLIAPAFFIPHYSVQEPVPDAQRTVVVHGWRDEVVPVENSIIFARKFGVELHLLNSDHRLNDQIPMLSILFAQLLDSLKTS